MKKLLAVCSVLFLVFAIEVQPVKADLFSDVNHTGESVFYGAGGYIYKNPPTSSVSHNLLDLGYKLGNAGSCGSFNLGASLKGIFNKDAAQSFLKNMGANAISSAPMLLMSYASPTLANTFMHIKDSSERLLTLRNQQCQAVEKAAMKAGILMRAKQEGKYRCMMEQQKQGATLNEAVQHCLNSSDTITKYIPLNATNSSQESKTVNVSSDIKSLTGMDNNEYNLFKEAVGDIKLNGNSILDNEQKDPVQTIYNKNVSKYNTALNNLVDDVGMNSIDNTEIAKIRKETGVTILPSSLVEMYNLKQTDPYTYGVFTNMLANKLALHKLNEEILNIESDLEIAKQKAQNQGNQDLASLLDKKSKLELERKRLIEREKAAEDTSRLLLQIHEQRINAAARGMVEGVRESNKNYINSKLYESTVPTALPKAEPGVESVLKRYMPNE